MARLLAASVAIALVLAPAGLAPVGAGQAGDSRQFRLSDVGYETTTYTGNGTHAVASIIVPKGARQGPERWFVIKLHFRITLDGVGPGPAYFSAATNGRTAIQLKLTGDGKTKVDYTMVGLVDGRQQGELRAAEGELRLANYLQDQGVTGDAPVEVSISMEPGPSLDIRSVTVFADSMIEETEYGPYPLSIRVPLEEVGAIRAGQTFSLPVEVAVTRPKTTAHSVEVTVTPEGALEVVGPRSLSIGDLSDKHETAFRIRAARPGEYRMTVEATSDYNDPSRVIGVHVGPARSKETLQPWMVVSLGALILGLAGVFVLRRNRRRSKVRALR